MQAHFDRRHVTLICAYSMRQSLRSGAGLVFLLLCLFFSLAVAQAIITPIEQLLQSEEARQLGPDAGAVVQRLIDFGRPVVEWALGGAGEREWVRYLLQERPALLSVVFLILLFGMPLVIPVGAFNQTAGEIGNRGMRYLLVRTERSNLFAGRFLAAVLLTLLAYAFSMATITLYLGLKLRLYGAWDLLAWSLLGYLALAVQSLPYVALCAWISARNQSALTSLVIASLVIGGVPFAAFLAGLSWAPAAHLQWLLPWGVHNDLLAPRWYQVALAALACLGYTAVYLVLGHRHFCKRDL